MKKKKHRPWNFSIEVLLEKKIKITTDFFLRKKKQKQKTLRFIKRKNVFYVIYKYIITCKYKDVL